jgi:hypothetical protein
MLSVVVIAAVPISVASTISTGGLGGFGVIRGMGMAAASCTVFAYSVR